MSEEKKVKKWKKGLRKHSLFYLVLVAFPLIMPEIFVNLLNTGLVKPMLAQIKYSVWLDMFALLLLGLAIRKFIIALKKAVFITASQLVYAWLTALVYSGFYFLTDTWAYLGILNSGHPYFHLALLIAIGLSILKLRQIARDKKLWNKTTTAMSLADDAPIESADDDDLSRSPSAEKIAKHLLSTKPEKSFAMAFCAAWGSGKTSYLKMVQEAVLNTDKSVIWVSFQPWLSHGSVHIIPDFLKEFESALSPYYPQIGKKIRNYSQSISALKKNTLVSNLNDIWGLVERPGTIRSQYADLNDSIEAINRKIIIDIDDIDRLDSKEIVEVMRLIRNTGNFTNTFYLCAFDREYVVAALNKINDHNNTNYLEKIFQAEVNLPRFDRSVLKSELLNKLKGTLDQDDLESLELIFEPKDPNILASAFLNISSESPTNAFNLCVKNLRDVTRLANNIKLIYTKELRCEVILNEFFRVQVLRLKYAKEIDLLYKNHEHIFAKITRQTDIFLSLKNQANVEAKERSNTNYDNFIDGLKNLKTPYPVAFQNEIESLFISAKGEGVPELSVQWLTRFHIVFGINLVGEYFSENTFQQYLTGKVDLERFLNGFEGQNSRYRLRRRLFDIKDYNSKDQFLKITRLWFWLIEQGEVEIAAVNHILFHKSQLNNVYQKLEAYTKSKYEEQLRQWIYQIEPVSRKALILRDLMVQVIYDEGKEEYVIVHSELLDRLIGILTSHLLEKGMDQQALVLHNYCIKSIEGTSRLIKIDEEANKVLRTKIEEEPEAYLKELIMPLTSSLTGREYAFHPFASQIFGSRGLFEEWLSQKASLLPKFRRLWTIYSEVKEKKELKGFKFEDYSFNRPIWVPEPEINDADYEPI